ncbi:Uncharacterised protein [Vibrio cholerae]|nr:Uncharacterised protein [Vibrio cholerae]CSH92072.1 Uncharacterised protein [Vibrio cholerae]
MSGTITITSRGFRLGSRSNSASSRSCSTSTSRIGL